MKVFRFIIAFSILVNSSSTFAATEQCRLIDGKKDRQACYDRQATAAETARKTSSESKAVGSVEQMKIEDDKLSKRLRSICKDC